jgi:hypothetical protein
MKKIFILCLVLAFAGKTLSQGDTTAPNPLTTTDGIAQQPVLSVQSFEYIRDVDPVSGKYWLNIPEADWIKDSIRKSFSDAIYRRWNIAMPETALSLKPLGFFSSTPKFNTKLKINN